MSQFLKNLVQRAAALAPSRPGAGEPGAPHLPGKSAGWQAGIEPPWHPQFPPTAPLPPAFPIHFTQPELPPQPGLPPAPVPADLQVLEQPAAPGELQSIHYTPPAAAELPLASSLPVSAHPLPGPGEALAPRRASSPAPLPPSQEGPPPILHAPPQSIVPRAASRPASPASPGEAGLRESFTQPVHPPADTAAVATLHPPLPAAVQDQPQSTRTRAPIVASRLIKPGSPQTPPGQSVPLEARAEHPRAPDSGSQPPESPRIHPPQLSPVAALRSQPADTGQSTQVEVHIGSIEIRAASRPAPAPAAPPPRPGSPPTPRGFASYAQLRGGNEGDRS